MQKYYPRKMYYKENPFAISIISGVALWGVCFPSLSLYVSHFIGQKSLLPFQSHTPVVYGKGHSLPPFLL